MYFATEEFKFDLSVPLLLVTKKLEYLEFNIVYCSIYGNF